MPAPDPEGIYFSEDANGRERLFAQIWPQSGLFASNRKHRLARLRAVARKVARDDWLCSYCRDPVPIWRRADARFCCEGCRKKAARQRRG